MKKSILALLVLSVGCFIFYSFILNRSNKTEFSSADRISFKIKGTGSKNIFVTIGIGSQPGSGSCCSGVSNNSTSGFSGEIGHVVYDGKTRRIITKIYRDLEGTTINLADYY